MSRKGLVSIQVSFVRYKKRSAFVLIYQEFYYYPKLHSIEEVHRAHNPEALRSKQNYIIIHYLLTMGYDCCSKLSTILDPNTAMDILPLKIATYERSATVASVNLVTRNLLLLFKIYVCTY